MRGTVGRDVVAHAAEQVDAVAGCAEGVAEAGEVAAVVGELVAEEGEVILFEGGGGEGRFGVEEPAELSDDGVALG